MSKIKVGDKVKVTDGSYTLLLKEDSVVDTYGIEINYEYWNVILTGMSFPVGSDGLKHDWTNNAMIQSQRDGRLVFISSKFLRLVKQCPHCHKDILS